MTPLVPLGELISEISKRKGQAGLEILSVTNTGGFQPSLERFDKQVFSADTALYKVVDPGDIAFNPTRIGVGSVAVLSRSTSGAVSPLYVVIRCKEKLLPEYLHRFLKSEVGRLHIATRSIAAVRPQLRFRDLQEILIPLPPIEEQRRRVSRFRDIDSIVAERARADRETERIAVHLYRRMFSAERAQEARWPVVGLGDQCTRLTVGHVGSMTSHYVPEGVPFLRGQNVKRGRLDLSDVQHVTPEFAASLLKSELHPGDVVSVRTGKPGTSAVVPRELSFANCADLIIATPGADVDPHFLAELLNQRLGDQPDLQHSVGAAQKHFNIGEARKIKFALPPLALQIEFSRKVLALDELRSAQAASGALLADARSAIEFRSFASTAQASS